MKFARFLVAVALAGSCSGGLDDIGQTESGVAPPGSDADLVGHSVPLSMNPGERLNVRVTMRNSGAASPANDWNSSYQLRRFPNSPTPFVFVSDAVIGTIPTNSDSNFDFVITAPSIPGAYSFDTSMYSAIAGQAGYFGEQVNIAGINVDPTVQRRWSCAFEAGL